MAIVELRTSPAKHAAARAALSRELAQRKGLRVLDPAVAAALTGVSVDSDDDAARAALDEARTAFGALDCGRARPAAEEAMLVLAGRAAAGYDERARLTSAWSYLLLCADRDGDAPVARAAADRLRALGAASAVPADLAAKYPDIDAATDRDIVEITVAAAADATVSIDHHAAPVRFVSAGKHVVAVAQPDGKRGAVMVTAHNQPLKDVEVPLVDRLGIWRDVAARVTTWQSPDVEPPTPGELRELMERVGVRFAVVYDKDGVSLWTLGPDQATALRADDVERDARAVLLGDAIQLRIASLKERAPDPDVPLMTEDDYEARVVRRDEPTRWWVYAVIGGALAASAATIYAFETGEDRQRIELTFP